MSYCTLTIASLLLCLALVHLTTAQNYHFSNGWYAGRKRSSQPSFHSQQPTVFDSDVKTSQEDSCSIRPEAFFLINKILQEEATRLQKVCTSETSNGLRELLESADTK